jgi:hypothetical protein
VVKDKAAGPDAGGKPTPSPAEKPDGKAEAKPDPRLDVLKPESTKDTSYSWDTKDVPDGMYMVKVVASDKTSNAAGALTGEKVSEAFVVVNKAPKLMLFKKSITVQPDRSAKIEGVATQALINIANAQYRVGTGDWMAAAPSDGIFDTNLEMISVTTQPLTKGSHTVEIKVYDAAGNTASQKTTVKVE